jgi:hypothetical protein
LHCLYCGEQIRRPRGQHASVNFCSGAHRTAYYQKAFQRPPVSHELAGFKPSSVAFEPHAGPQPQALENDQALRLPGTWHLSSTSKRGISAPMSFSSKRVLASIIAPVRANQVLTSPVPNRVKRCILPELGETSGSDLDLGSISQRTRPYIPKISTPPAELQDIWQAANPWKDSPETFQPLTLRDSFEILQQVPLLHLEPETAIIPAVQALESLPTLNPQWLDQPRRAAQGVENCLPAVSRFEREEGPRFASLDAASVDARIIEPEFASVTSRRPPTKLRQQLNFRLSSSLAIQLSSTRAPFPDIVKPRPVGPTEKNRPPISKPLNVRKPAAIRRPEVGGLHNAERWAALRRPSPHLPEMPVPSELTKNPERVRMPLRFGYSSSAEGLGPLPPALGAAVQCALRILTDPPPSECAPLNVPLLRTGSVNLQIGGLAPIVATRKGAELRPSETIALDPDTFTVLRAQEFPTRIAIRSAANLIATGLREAAGVAAGIGGMPDSPVRLAFPNRPPALQAPPAIAHVAPHAIPQVGRFAGSPASLSTPAEGQIITAEAHSQSTPRMPVRVPAMGHLGIASALSQFAAVAPSLEKRSSQLSGLGQRLFNPIPPSLRPRVLKPGGFEILKPVLSSARFPIPLDHRWDRNGRMWDRSGRLKSRANSIAFAELRFQLGSTVGGPLD